MIQANELRIGNYINHNDGSQTDDIRRVSAIHKDGVESIVKGCRFATAIRSNALVYPIALTEEILLNCGFVRRGITSNNGGKLTLHHKDNMYPNGRVYWNSWCILDSIPKHLHQLQNLYFALTGEELEFSLT